MSEGRDDLPGVSEEAILGEEQDNGWEGGEEEIQEEVAPGKDETTTEIVKRSYDTLKRQSAGTPKEGGQAQVPPQRPQGSGRENLVPPQRLTVEQKELFGQMAPPLQKAVHDMFRHHEGLLTKVSQEARAAQQEASHIIEVVRPYLRSHPELTEQGLTEAKLVAGLLAAHERLSNPQTAMKAFIEIGSQLGIDSNKLQAALGQGGNNQNDISNHPQFQALQQELARVSSTVNQSQSAQQQYAMQQRETAISQVTSEMEAVREERDASGRYLYPRLHDDAFLLDTKPLVATLAKRFPQLGYGELLKRAHDILAQQEDGQAQPGFQGSPRLPQQTTRYVPPQAAGVSVRGRGAPLVPGDADDIPEEALKDSRSAVVWALKQQRGGR
jgi:hypothetical protein